MGSPARLGALPLRHITATETAGRDTTYLATVTWHHDGIAFKAYAYITTAPASQDPAQ